MMLLLIIAKSRINNKTTMLSNCILQNHENLSSGCSIFSTSLGKKAIKNSHHRSLSKSKYKIKIISNPNKAVHPIFSWQESCATPGVTVLSRNHVRFESRKFQTISSSISKKPNCNPAAVRRSICLAAAATETPCSVPLQEIESAEKNFTKNEFMRSTMVITQTRKTALESIWEESPQQYQDSFGRKLSQHESDIILQRSAQRKSVVLFGNLSEDTKGLEKIKSQRQFNTFKRIGLDDIREVITQFDSSENVSVAEHNKSEFSEVVSTGENLMWRSRIRTLGIADQSSV